jgi:hypothetical protein
MSTYGGIRKVSGDSWTDEEMQHVRALQAKMDKKSVQAMKKEGLDFQLIAIPLPDVKGWGKYSRDVEVKKFLAPYQTINPYRLRKPIVD